MNTYKNPAFETDEPKVETDTIVAEIWINDFPNQVEVHLWYQQRGNKVIVTDYESTSDLSDYDDQVRDEIERSFPDHTDVEFKP